MDEVRDAMIAYSGAVKNVDPGALVAGPEEWGWPAYFYSGFDQDTALAVAFLIQTQQILPVTILGIALAPEFIFQKRRKAARPDNILPDEPVPTERRAEARR